MFGKTLLILKFIMENKSSAPLGKKILCSFCGSVDSVIDVDEYLASIIGKLVTANEFGHYYEQIVRSIRYLISQMKPNSPLANFVNYPTTYNVFLV